MSIPYLKGFFRNSCNKSDDKTKGINEASMLDYCQSPGLHMERKFSVLEKDGDEHLSAWESMRSPSNSAENLLLAENCGI